MTAMDVGADVVAAKLPHEEEHAQALLRMRSLEPYYRWTRERFKGHVGRRVLDAGAGVGNFTALLEQDADYVLAIDLSPLNIGAMRERFAGSPVVEVAMLDLDEHVARLAERKLDTVVCLDVLEHVEDDVALLRTFHRITQPGGKLLIKVPAGKWLFGSIDEASGHFRRYNRQELAEKATAAGWRVVETAYMNVWGVLPYFLKSRVLRREANFSRTFTPWQLSLIRRIMPVLRTGDRLLGPPLGQSALLIAERPS